MPGSHLCVASRTPWLNRLTLTQALELMRRHFRPLGLEVSFETPDSLLVRVLDPLTAAPLLTVTGIRCNTKLTHEEIDRLIQALETDLEVIHPNNPFTRRTE